MKVTALYKNFVLLYTYVVTENPEPHELYVTGLVSEKNNNGLTMVKYFLN